MQNRFPPKYTYNGLTIILSNKSRHDGVDIYQGTGGYFFTNKCLAPNTNRYCCDTQLIADFNSVLPDTKCILALGQRALDILFPNLKISLDDQRGSPLEWGGIPVIVSYLPQDAVDMQNYEKKYNKDAYENLQKSTEQSENFSDDDDDDEKSRSKTSRKNWSFWLEKDTKKALRIVDNKGRLPAPSFTPEYIIQPPSLEVIDILQSTRGCDFFIDLENDPVSLDIRCFAFGFSRQPKYIYTVPILNVDYKPAYGNIYQILRALAFALKYNTVVAHNGCGHDFPLLAYKLGLGVGRNIYDTMVAQKRIYTNVEKSLGHCVSLWTYQPYHKDEGNHAYRTQQQAEQLYLYCGKDVYTMMLVKEAQLAFASTIKGLLASINQANASINSLLTMSLTGMLYDEEYRNIIIKRNDALMEQYIRCMSILTGPKVDPLISNLKCTKYFHTLLGYPIVGRTKQNNPSLSADNLLKLRLKHENPVIDFLLAYRSRQGETSKALKFTEWVKATSCQSS